MMSLDNNIRELEEMRQTLESYHHGNMVATPIVFNGFNNVLGLQWESKITGEYREGIIWDTEWTKN